MFVADVDRTSRDYQTTIATYEKFLSDHHVSQQIDVGLRRRVGWGLGEVFEMLVDWVMVLGVRGWVRFLSSIEIKNHSKLSII